MSRPKGNLGSGRSLLMSTKTADVKYRRQLIEKYVSNGSNRAEAERLALLELFRDEIRFLMKKIPAERLEAAVKEALVEEVHNS